VLLSRNSLITRRRYAIGSSGGNELPIANDPKNTRNPRSLAIIIEAGRYDRTGAIDDIHA